MKFAHHDPGSLARRNTGPGTQAGGRSEDIHRHKVARCPGLARIVNTVNTMTGRAGLALCAAAALLGTGCTHWVAGLPVRGAELAEPGALTADRVLLSQEQMQAITGAGMDLTIIPGMSTTSPVDDDGLAATVPPECRFIFAETSIFGTDLSDFRKVVFQYPPRRALISEAAAVYPDPTAARRAFDAFSADVATCADSPAAVLLGGWTLTEDQLRTRPRDCGRDYRLKHAVLIEVISCGLPESVGEIVLANLGNRVPD